MYCFILVDGAALDHYLKLGDWDFKGHDVHDGHRTNTIEECAAKSDAANNPGFVFIHYDSQCYRKARFPTEHACTRKTDISTYFKIGKHIYWVDHLSRIVMT